MPLRQRGSGVALGDMGARSASTASVDEWNAAFDTEAGEGGLRTQQFFSSVERERLAAGKKPAVGVVHKPAARSGASPHPCTLPQQGSNALCVQALHAGGRLVREHRVTRTPRQAPGYEDALEIGVLWLAGYRPATRRRWLFWAAFLCGA